MSAFALCLDSFITPVPSCELSVGFAWVLDMFRQGECDRIVITDERQSPIGVLYWHHLAPYLMANPGQEGFDSDPFDPDRPLAELGAELIKPLTILPASFQLGRFFAYLKQEQKGGALEIIGHQVSCPAYALVDESGKFLGLLNQLHLLRFLIDKPAALSAVHSLSQPSLGLGANQGVDRSSQASIDPLVQFLERLPIPLMLQTSTGQLHSQNLAWREQIGELRNPAGIQQEAAAFLESPTLPSPLLSETSVSSQQWNQSAWFREEAAEDCVGPHCALAAPLREASHSSNMEAFTSEGRAGDPTPQFCQLGSRPDTCICICPMKNGQERVWQFVKIPLGVVSPQLNLELADKWLHWENSVEELTAQVFRLATLGPEEGDTLAAVVRKQPELMPEDNTLWLVLAQDVTEQQQVAKELAAKNADLVQLNRLKDEFLACISHELKTPLTAVLGLSGLLKGQVLGTLNERQARYVGLIHQSGRNLMSVVNDILDLTRMETGQLELTLRSVNIAKVCDRAFKLAQQLPHLKSKPETLEDQNTPPDTPFTLEIEPGLDRLVADELRLRQMLAHLLANSLKFTQPGDEMGLRVSLWEGWIAFTVWDTGIGIPAEKQHLIFQKFQQLENPLTRQFEGTGLGLVLTQRLARLHGGDVSFISKEGEGSQFTLLLPPSPPRKRGSDRNENNFIAPSYPSLASSFPQQNRLVLIVEAVPQFIDTLAEQLTGLGYRFAIARSGTEAVEKARRLQPCAIFLNPLLPLLGGWDVLTLLKADRATRHIPTIVTATQAEKDKAYHNRADSFLSLPIQTHALQQVLARLTAQPGTADSEKYLGYSLTILYLRACHLPASDPDAAKQTEPPRSKASSLDSSDPVRFDSDADWLEQEPDRSWDWTSRRSLNQPMETGLASDLSKLLHLYQYRVLEADDLEQAELLSRVWQPDAMLLDCTLANPEHYLETLSQHPSLAALPIVTVDPITAQVANQIAELSVYPCLATSETFTTSALLKAIQVAAGIGWKPSILVLDIARVPDLAAPASEQVCRDSEFGAWVQALIQYIQTAGFRGLIGHSWAETLQQIQYCSIDLLLIYLEETQPYPAMERAIRVLQQLSVKPPILLLDRRCELDRIPPQSTAIAEGGASTTSAGKRSKQTPALENKQFDSLLQSVASEILPASLTMEQLLERIRQTLGQS